MTRMSRLRDAKRIKSPTINAVTIHGLYVDDAVRFLKQVPDASIQLMLIDPPYNLALDTWDVYEDYLAWARQWLCEIYRVLKPTGNCVIFGGFQFQNRKCGDLLEIMHYLRHQTNLMFVNLIVWHYRNGMGARRFFSNRHEEAIWVAKSAKYYFDLDSVRIPYSEVAKVQALKDKRLNPANIEKGKNPTNVWEVGRLNANSSERVGHPTQKPVELIRRFVRALSRKCDIVLDCFAGSGTTGRVCMEEGRHSILVDTNPEIKDYFAQHISNMENTIGHLDYELREHQQVDMLIADMEDRI